VKALEAIQLDLLRAVQTLTEGLGRAPSLRELVEETGRDISAVHASMRRLELRGLATCPRVVHVGYWGVTKKGKEAIGE
jgi:predicted transcriptional regulator